MYDTYVALSNLLEALDDLSGKDFYYDNEDLIDRLKDDAIELKHELKKELEEE